jgi:hypothetical protein
MQKENLKDYTYRQHIVKKLLDNKEGRAFIEYLLDLYDVKDPSGNSSMAYFLLGKRKAIKELEALVNSKVKDKNEKS